MIDFPSKKEINKAIKEKEFKSKSKCDYCFNVVKNSKIKKIQILKWKKDNLKGIRNVCLNCRKHLKGEYKLVEK